MLPRLRTFFLCLPLVLLLSPTPPAAADEAETDDRDGRFKLGLVIGNEKRSRTDGDVLNAATEAFVASRRFVVAERHELDAVFTEKDLQDFLGKGDSDLSRILGLDYLGIVNYYNERQRVASGGSRDVVIIEVRLVDADTGEITTTISSDRADTLSPPSGVRGAADLLFENIRAAFPPMGFIVRLQGEEITVDMGSQLGLQEGDRLEVVRDGERIIHPVTGRALPAEQIVIGKLKVIDVEPHMATCRLKDAEEEIGLGDRVRLEAGESGWRKHLGRIGRSLSFLRR